MGDDESEEFGVGHRLGVEAKAATAFAPAAAAPAELAALTRWNGV